MKYELVSVDFAGARFVANADGTTTASGIVSVAGITGSYPGKFLQRDYVPDVIIPAQTTTANQPAFLEAAAAAFVAQTYPDTP